jgi:hypothetical protein
VNAYEYILLKQIQWALNNKIDLVGSKDDRGRLAYTKKLEDNLFRPLEPKVREYFEGGDGGELKATPGKTLKMHAVHSSSALTVNIFQYWLIINQIPAIAAACGFCNKSNKSSIKIKFETKFPIDPKFPRSPNIDVIFENSDESRFKAFAIECKFSEAYSSRGHSGIDPKYFISDEFWTDLPNLKCFSRTISPRDTSFQYLHSGQLVKHILGLRKRYGKSRFRLLYLWYDCLGLPGSKHREEIEVFTKVTKSDNIKFHALSYQELIFKLSTEYRNPHFDYIKYISDRYL